MIDPEFRLHNLRRPPCTSKVDQKLGAVLQVLGWLVRATFDKRPIGILSNLGVASFGTTLDGFLRTENGMKNLLRIGVFAFGACLLAGCMDGPFYAMKRANPFYRSQWKKDRELGPTFEDRQAQLHLLESQIATMAPAEQDRWAQQLEKIVRDDPSSEMRAKVVATLGKLPYESAERGLNTASADDVEKVRLAACKAWATRGGPAARDMLMSLARADESTSVRQAAVDSLASFNEPEVLRSLASLLEDSSPAVQYQVAQSLASLTGEKYGGNIDQWKQYVDGLTPTPGSSGADNPQILPASTTMGQPFQPQRL